MTIDEFLVEVEQTTINGTAWRLNGNCIESVHDLLCPIHEIAWHHWEPEIEGEDVHDEGIQMGLSSRSITAIVRAADGKTNGRLRRRLLKACRID